MHGVSRERLLPEGARFQRSGLGAHLVVLLLLHGVAGEADALHVLLLPLHLLRVLLPGVVQVRLVLPHAKPNFHVSQHGLSYSRQQYTRRCLQGP